MTSLDALLAEVGPILNSSQFTHPSFQEVLAARQFADEINSGRLSVKDAYLNFWSHVASNGPKEINADFRKIRPEWHIYLTRLSNMLSEKAAGDFICVVSESYFSIKNKDSIRWYGLFDKVLDDLSMCAMYIRAHPALQSTECAKQVQGVSDELLSQYRSRAESGDVDERIAGAEGLIKARRLCITNPEPIPPPPDFGLRITP